VQNTLSHIFDFLFMHAAGALTAVRFTLSSPFCEKSTPLDRQDCPDKAEGCNPRLSLEDDCETTRAPSRVPPSGRDAAFNKLRLQKQ